MDALDKLRVVLVHDWLTGMRGGEKVLEVFCRRWPDAPLYTLLRKKGSVAPIIENRAVRTSFLQWFPGVHRYYRYLLPLMPWAARWQAPSCDLLLSSSHCVAKGALAPPGVPHVCYCYTPMRYAWHMQEAYFRRRGVKAWLVNRLLSRLREWDRRTSENVAHFIAISQTVRQRIADCYNRSSAVIYPPVDTDFYTPSHESREDFLLLFSAFAPYKRLDLAIEACNRLKKRLVVIGTGQDEKKLKKLAGPSVQFMGWQSGEVVRDHMRRCQALLFPGEEDFGIVPVEAMACAAPVIAFARGGATETVVPPGGAAEPTGLWFEEQNADCLITSIEELERREFNPQALRRRALQFSYPRFESEFFGYIAKVLAGPARLAA